MDSKMEEEIFFSEKNRGQEMLPKMKFPYSRRENFTLYTEYYRRRH